jgi:mono/diheme cytochrome c family protein
MRCATWAEVGAAQRAAKSSLAAGLLIAVTGCVTEPLPPPPPPTAEELLIERGRTIFFTETFAGNGRTCGTCHREEDSFGLSPALIATLPPDDPLFVAETNPDLVRDFETPKLMRAQGLIRENLDGFDDLSNTFVLRGVPHVLSLSTSVDSRTGPHTGWSGDGAPGDGSLRAFATGAVIQHFTKTNTRIPGVDFRLPTEDELDAIAAFTLSLGRQEDLTLPLPLTDAGVARGQQVFVSRTEGKCSGCHVNAGANADPALFGAGAGNLNFDTGVEAAPGKPQDGSGELVPPDDGLGTPGDGTFNTPPLVEAADTGPFFHDGSVATLEDSVAFYSGAAFNDSPAGRALAGATGSGISLTDEQNRDVAAFLRVLNALENIREAELYLADARGSGIPERAARGAPLATEEIRDAIRVLRERGLHPEAVAQLETSLRYIGDIREGARGRRAIDAALGALAVARQTMRQGG